MPADETKLYSLSEANNFFARNYNGVCWTYLEKDERSTDDTAKMVNFAHASLLHWSESDQCAPVNLQRGEYLVSMAYSFAGRGEPAYYHAKRCFDQTFSNAESMDFDVAHAYMVMARALTLTGQEEEAKGYLIKMVDAGRQIKNSKDKQIFISDLSSGNWFGLTDLVRESIKLVTSGL
jgi:hypothetical protein